MKPTPAPPEPAEPPRIDLAAPWRWLALGWRDLRAHPIPGLLHGLLASAVGLAAMTWAGQQFWWLVGAYSALLLLAPLLLVGLIELSRQAQLGRPAGLPAVVRLWCSAEKRLVLFGVLLGLTGMVWVLTSAALIWTLADQPIATWNDFLRFVVLAPDDWLFMLWVMLGALLAAPVFASSVATQALLLDTEQPLPVALAHSWRAVANHPVVMVLWAMLITALVLVGLATYMLGLIIVLPWLGHATWHAYVDLKRSGAFGLPGAFGGVR